jgi:hypothetical protein
LRPLLLARTFEGDSLRAPKRPCLRLIVHKCRAKAARTPHGVRPDQPGDHHDAGDSEVSCEL